MRWFMDTEFNEDGRTIELISIALVSEQGHEYYAHSADYDANACNDWVKANVLPKVGELPRKPRTQIRDEILSLISAESNPEFWAYFADYDWVAFCQLFGRMIDLPVGYPMFCMDLKQLMRAKGVKRHNLPLGTLDGEHNALEDARWVRGAVLHIDPRGT